MRALNGRMNRPTYWLSFGIVVLLYVAINFMSDKPIAASEVVFVFLCVPRLHDIGKSGWFVLIGFAVELVGVVVGFSFFALEEAKAVMGLAVLVMVGLAIWLGTMRGEPFANKWGEPPLPGLNFRQRDPVSGETRPEA